jgi:hypothetical protein
VAAERRAAGSEVPAAGVPARLARAVVPALLLLAAPAAALDPAKAIGQYSRDGWTTVQGLPQASVLALAQTRDGHLWIGTTAGLARFDGHEFTVFDPSVTPGLQGRHVRPPGPVGRSIEPALIPAQRARRLAVDRHERQGHHALP